MAVWPGHLVGRQLLRATAWAVLLLAACGRVGPAPLPEPEAARINLDAETQALITTAARAVFVIPFSHWDTDWHEDYAAYARRSDDNIRLAIAMARRDPRYRYTLEQVLFVQHFWDAHPELRAELTAAVHRRQITFAWAGIIQPETSLAAPAIQARNWQLGRDWIAATFGEAYVPVTAWQSDAFGNSAALPAFLNRAGIPFLYIGRPQFRCAPEQADCVPLPAAFHWKSPADGARVLTAYLPYPLAWDAFHRLETDAEKLAALQGVIDEQFQRSTGKYLLLPVGSDFVDPVAELPALVAAWNAAAGASGTALVMADPETAFRYLATQPLPEFTVDLNPIWQAFYATRPFAKIADKESEYYLTAADKFGLLVDRPASTAWLTATLNAHYDNIGAVSFDAVWEASQRPRFVETLDTAARDLAATLAAVAGGVPAPVVIFNPTSWTRSEVVELRGDLPPTAGLPQPVQTLGPDHIAFWASNIPGIGYAAPAPEEAALAHPVTIVTTAAGLTLANGQVSATLAPERGGALTHLAAAGGPNVLTGPREDLALWDDAGDVYGARFGDVRARASEAPGQLTVLAAGPLVARVQVAFLLAGQLVTKTVTLRANSPLVEVALELQAAPEASAVLHVPTALAASARTDDLGFLAFTHAVDGRPLASGDITYRRKIFYPVMAWSDVSTAGAGLTLITHGLQAVGGVPGLHVLLARSVSDEGNEGVLDQDRHTLRYAYRPHGGAAGAVWQSAYAFNQPLIPVWRSRMGAYQVQIPFRVRPEIVPAGPPGAPAPLAVTVLTAQSGLVADLYPAGEAVRALIIDYDPDTPVTVVAGASQFTVDTRDHWWRTLTLGR